VDIGEPNGDAVGKRDGVPIALEEEEDAVGTADGGEVGRGVRPAVGTTPGAKEDLNDGGCVGADVSAGVG
jgi:hypothetical protein